MKLLTALFCSLTACLLSCVECLPSKSSNTNTFQSTRQERPHGRNQTGQPIGSPSDTVDHRFDVAYIAPYSSSRKHGGKSSSTRPQGLQGFPFAEYNAYDPVDRGQEQEYSYGYGPRRQNHYNHNHNGIVPSYQRGFPAYGGYETGIEYEYEAPYDFNYGRNLPTRSSYGSVPVQGYDAQASPYSRSQSPYYPREYESYSQFRNDHDELFPSARLGFGFGLNESPLGNAQHGSNGLYQGLYDSPNVVPYNTHDYKKYPYGYSGSKSTRRSAFDTNSRFAEASNMLASLISGSRPIAYRPRFRQSASLTDRNRPTPGFSGDREFLAPSLVPAAAPVASPVNSRPYDSLLPLLRSFMAGGGDGSFERSDYFEHPSPRNLVLPFWANFFKS